MAADRLGRALACQRSDPPPGTPAEAAPCPEDAGTELPRELACCLIQARTAEDAQICLAKADGGLTGAHVRQARER